MSNTFKIYVSQFIAIFFTYTAISEFLKSTLILLSIIFTIQRLYAGFLDLQEKKEKRKNKQLNN